MSLVPAWSPFFPANARMRGKALTLQKKVTVLEPRDGEIARTEVDDPEDGAHTVTLAADKKQVASDCSCDTFTGGTFCPHIWATLLSVQTDKTTLGQLRKLKPRPPKAKKRAGAALREKDPEWMNRLTLLRPTSVDLDNTPAMGVQRRLTYVILTELSERQHGLFVEVRFSTPTTTGWSKPKALKLSPYIVSGLTDPADRRLCGLIMGATGVLDSDMDTMRSERACSVFRLTPGLRRELLKQLIATKRCYLDSALDKQGDDAPPMRWQEQAPWSLWMTGTQAMEEAELAINAELRRDIRVSTAALPTLPGDVANAPAAATVTDADAPAPAAAAKAAVMSEGEREAEEDALAEAAEREPKATEGETGEQAQATKAAKQANAQAEAELAAELQAEAGLIDGETEVDADAEAEVDETDADAEATEVTADADSEVDADDETDAETSDDDANQPALTTQTQTVPVDAPALIFGGRDGLVVFPDHAAPFDDHDAFRWASQFRDAAILNPGQAPIRVPLTDLDRFFDRLYLLPQLPNIDLPEGMGPEEVTVQPEPCLEVFSPESPQATEILPPSTKNTLVGRVIFRYGPQRISPVQSGRYVPVAPDQERALEEALNQTPAPGSAPGSSEGETAEGEGTPDIAAIQADIDAAQAAEVLAAQDASLSDTDSKPEDAAEGDNQADGDSNAGEGLARRRLVRRDPTAEQEAMEQALAAGFRPAGVEAGDTLLIHSKDVGQAISTLSATGWSVLADQRVVRTAGTPSLSVVSGIDWFELRGGVTFTLEDGTEVVISLPEILQAARSGRQMIELADGTHGLIPEAWLEENGMLVAMGEISGDSLRFKPSQAALLDAMLRDQDMVEVDPAFDAIRARLAEFKGVKPADAPTGFLGTLREYQAEGTGWFGFLRWFGVGGVLADDMGLGKTVQVLAMLQGRKIDDPNFADPPIPAMPGAEGKNLGTSAHELAQMQALAKKSDDDGVDRSPLPSRGKTNLIIAPRSVLFNWMDEAKKFTPDMKIMAYAGTERQALREAFDEHDLVVTTYGLMRRDIDELSRYRFDYVVLDEAQAIKNPASQSSKAARLLSSRHRLALTGTPVENHLGDLWSIFEYLNPGMLGSHLRFAEMIRSTSTIAATQADQQAVPQIGKALRPFILRRTKTQVLKDLPPKTEQTLVCEMEPAQQAVYDEMKSYYRGNLLKQLDEQGVAASGGVGKQSFMVLEALLRLRQAACHPGLIDENRKAERSAKCDVLYERLADIIDEGSKALVFSQFTSMLDIVRMGLQERGIRYCYLDGQTRDRREVVDQFQNDPSNSVFLISLKAGGFGLNLTEAEYVFIMDPWWNPAVEAQAIDRAHRMGQTKPVFAYRLVCKDTVEQRILDLQQQKRELADAIVGGEQNPLKSLSRQDLENLLT